VPRPAAPALALLAAALAGPATGTDGVPSPARGLAFAVTLKGSGEALAAGPYQLRIPGGNGPLRLELFRLAVEGARLRGEVRLRNESGLLLAGLALDFESATPVRRETTAPSEAAPVPVSLAAPLALGDLLPGEETPGVSFELSPVSLGEGVALTTLLGAVRGLAAEPPFVVEGTTRPVALDADRSGRLYVATGGVGRVLRTTPPSLGVPAEAARPSSSPAGVALRRRNGDLFVSSGDRRIEVFRPGREKPAILDAGRPVTALRIDARGILRAASGNGVLTFDEAMPGALRALGPEGSTIVSFDTDAGGVVHAVVRDEASRRLMVAQRGGPTPFPQRKGAGADVLETPSACRFDGDGALWVAAVPGAGESTVLARFGGEGAPLGAFSRLALALLLGRDEDAAVPEVVDLAPGPERRLYVLLEDGSAFALRPF
jgi:hypothetical protein